MGNIEIKNAIIGSVSLSTADHGCLSSFIHLDYGGCGQGFGGYNLFSVGCKLEKSGRNVAGLFISKCMEMADVTEWNDMVGKTVRVKAENGKVHAIGHIVKDKWFDPAVEFKEEE